MLKSPSLSPLITRPASLEGSLLYAWWLILINLLFSDGVIIYTLILYFRRIKLLVMLILLIFCIINNIICYTNMSLSTLRYQSIYTHKSSSLVHLDLTTVWCQILLQSTSSTPAHFPCLNMSQGLSLLLPLSEPFWFWRFFIDSGRLVYI